jgi:hypothetical protein
MWAPAALLEPLPTDESERLLQMHTRRNETQATNEEFTEYVLNCAVFELERNPQSLPMDAKLFVLASMGLPINSASYEDLALQVGSTMSHYGRDLIKACREGRFDAVLRLITCEPNFTHLMINPLLVAMVPMVVDQVRPTSLWILRHC